MKRHLARMSNTDQRVVVVMMQIPDRLDHALIVATDNLPPRWEQHIMTIVESPEAQGDPELANVLARRLMPDTTQTVLVALHEAGLLHAVNIDRVVMFPEPNRPYALRQILQAMNRLVPDEYGVVDRLNEAAAPPVKGAKPNQIVAAPVPPPNSSQEEFKYNPHTENQTAQVSQNTTGIASNLLAEAADLEAIAKAKREKAYTFAPHLRPQPRKTAPTPVAVVEAPVKAATKKRAVAPSRKKAGGA
jgi:hypothetical protein